MKISILFLAAPLCGIACANTTPARTHRPLTSADDIPAGDRTRNNAVFVANRITPDGSFPVGAVTCAGRPSSEDSSAAWMIASTSFYGMTFFLQHNF